MSIRSMLPVVVRPLAAIAIAATTPLTLALSAGLAVGQDQPGAKALTGTAALEEARRLIDNGRPFEARALLVRTFQDDTVHVGDQFKVTPSESRTQAMVLMAEASRKMRTMDPMDASLQKAKVALDEGDIRLAERHARGVLKSATATPEQAGQAEHLLKTVDQRRSELAPATADALAQAERDFLAGRYAQAKAGLLMVDRSGVPLTVDQQSMLDKYQLKLVEIGNNEPGLFGRAGDMSVLQPGIVKRREDTPAADKPADKPADPPAPAAEQPPAKPAPKPAPVALPPDKPAATATQPPTDDPIKQAMRTEAASVLAQADAAFDARKLNEAAGKYSRLKGELRDSLTPDQVKHVESRLNECRLILAGGTIPPPDVELGPVIKDRTKRIFEAEMADADKAIKSGNASDARDHVASAQLQLNSTRQYFPESEFENYTKRLTDKKAEITKVEQHQIEENLKKQTAESAKNAAESDKIQRAEREKKILELVDRARAYQSEMRYQEALQAVDQLLFLDPINPTGLLLHDVISDIILLKADSDIYVQKNKGFAKLSTDNQRASIPDAEIYNFPSDWPAISVRRGEPVAFADSIENRRVLADLNAKRIPSVAFTDNSLSDVVQFVQTVTQQNLDVDWASLEQANIQKETTVSLNLTNVTIKTLLDRVVEKISGSDKSSRADWTVNEGVVTIASEDKIRKNTVLVIYDVHDLLLEVPDYTDVPRIDLQQALQSNQGGGGGQSPFREQGNNDRQQQLRDRQQRMDDLISIITSNIDFEGWQDNGGDTGKIQKLINNANLIITNTPKNHRAISGLLGKLREIRAMQINVETRFLLVNQSYFEQIGFDLDVYLNANNNQVTAARATSGQSVLASDLFTGGALNHNTAAPVGTAQNPIRPNSWSPIAFQQDSLGLASTLAPRSDWSDAILAASPALGIGGQFLDDIQVDFLVQATQADRRAIQLTAPRLTFTNGQTSNIYVATQTAFVSDLTPVVGDSAVGFDPTVSVVTEGVTLLVEGTVTADRRYVTMNVDAGVARVDGFAQEAVTAIAGGQLVNSATAQSFIQLPKVTVTRVRTTVTVPDQGTILMGGQRLVTEYEVETGVPVLSKLPILNRFFTNRVESKEEQTLLILIKPTILIQNEEEEKNYPGLLDSLKSGLGG